MYTAVSGALLAAQCLRVGNQGRQIQLCLFDQAVEEHAHADQFYMNANGRHGIWLAASNGAGTKESSPTVWPVSGQYCTSTEFFKAAISNEWLTGIDLSMFSAPGIKAPANPISPAGFTADNNAWGVVMLETEKDTKHVSIRHKNTPLLFTRNIGFGTPPGPPWEGATIADMSGLIPNAKPFGDRVGIIVTYGGSVKILPAELVTQTNFNPQGETLEFLMP